MSCPSCNSDQWKLASLVYQEGLSTIDATTRVIGTGIGPSGIGTGAGTAYTSGIRQSALSAAAAPPKGSVIVGILFIVLVFCGLSFVFFSPVIPLVYVITAVSAVALVALFPRARRKHNARMATYRMTRMCQRCGTLYLP
jgi:hypothetical protein